jgi:two-component system, cell cycle response regulator CtrA
MQSLKCYRFDKGSTITPDMFLNYLYSGANEPLPQIIDVYICTLSKKLAVACGGEDYTCTVRGRGYELNHAENATRAA